MPELRGLATTQRRMARLERAYERWLKERTGGLRESLAAWTLDAWGRPGLEVVWRSELNRLAEDEWRERQRWLKEAWALGAGWAARQAGALGRYVQDVPSERALRMAVETAWNGAPKPRWVDALTATLLAEAQRLWLSEEEAERAVQRLFGVGKPDGRASTWELGLLKASMEFVLVAWGAFNGAAHMGLVQANEATVEEVKRQAIAVIDERTTDCCLRVHGQIVGEKEPFRLTGTPRFANRMMNPPFHWHCRTVVTFWHPALEEVGIPTAKMREAAQAELRYRQEHGVPRRRKPQGRWKYGEIHPAHATSRRR